MHEIIPGILEKEWHEIEQKIELVRPFAKTIHIDLIDGKFVDNKTFMDPKPFAQYADEFFLELHMMVEEPIQYLQSFADAGFKRFIGHVEKMSDQAEFVARGQLLGEVGLALDGQTPLTEIGIPIDDLDVLLAMSIQAGLSGQTFIAENLEKLETIQDTTWIPIEVDGGINDTTIIMAKQMGATRFVTTNFLFNSKDPHKQYERLHSCL